MCHDMQSYVYYRDLRLTGFLDVLFAYWEFTFSFCQRSELNGGVEDKLYMSIASKYPFGKDYSI